MCTYNMVFIFALFLFSNAVDVGEEKNTLPACECDQSGVQKDATEQNAYCFLEQTPCTALDDFIYEATATWSYCSYKGTPQVTCDLCPLCETDWENLPMTCSQFQTAFPECMECDLKNCPAEQTVAVEYELKTIERGDVVEKPAKSVSRSVCERNDLVAATKEVCTSVAKSMNLDLKEVAKEFWTTQYDSIPDGCYYKPYGSKGAAIFWMGEEEQFNFKYNTRYSGDFVENTKFIQLVCNAESTEEPSSIEGPTEKPGCAGKEDKWSTTCATIDTENYCAMGVYQTNCAKTCCRQNEGCSYNACTDCVSANEQIGDATKRVCDWVKGACQDIKDPANASWKTLTVSASYDCPTTTTSTTKAATDAPSCDGNLMEDESCCPYANCRWGDFSNDPLYPEECCDEPVTKENTCPDVEPLFESQGSGKCVTLQGNDPANQYIAQEGFEGCQSRCIKHSKCFGFSASSYGNCLLWLQSDIMGGGQSWGNAECFVKNEVSLSTTTETAACECSDVWTSEEDGGECVDEQIGCTNCDGDARDWCIVKDDNCKGVQTDENGNSDGWFFCLSELTEQSVGEESAVAVEWSCEKERNCEDASMVQGCEIDTKEDNWDAASSLEGCQIWADATCNAKVVVFWPGNSCSGYSENCPFGEKDYPFGNVDFCTKTEKAINTENKALALKNAQLMREIEQAIGGSDEAADGSAECPPILGFTCSNIGELQKKSGAGTFVRGNDGSNCDYTTVTVQECGGSGLCDAENGKCIKTNKCSGTMEEAWGCANVCINEVDKQYHWGESCTTNALFTTISIEGVCGDDATCTQKPIGQCSDSNIWTYKYCPGQPLAGEATATKKATNTENKALALKNAQLMREIEQAIGRSDANKAQQLRKANKAQQLREANQALRTALKALTARD